MSRIDNLRAAFKNWRLPAKAKNSLEEMLRAPAPVDGKWSPLPIDTKAMATPRMGNIDSGMMRFFENERDQAKKLLSVCHPAIHLKNDPFFGLFDDTQPPPSINQIKDFDKMLCTEYANSPSRLEQARKHAQKYFMARHLLEDTHVYVPTDTGLKPKARFTKAQGHKKEIIADGKKWVRDMNMAIALVGSPPLHTSVPQDLEHLARLAGQMHIEGARMVTALNTQKKPILDNIKKRLDSCDYMQDIASPPVTPGTSPPLQLRTLNKLMRLNIRNLKMASAIRSIPTQIKLKM